MELRNAKKTGFDDHIIFTARLPAELVENDAHEDEESGDSENLKAGQIIPIRKLRDENSMLKRKDLKTVVAREAIPATSTSAPATIKLSTITSYPAADAL